MSKYTPGPWTYCRKGHRFQIEATLAEAQSYIVSETSYEANAQLISAAPDLYCALHRLHFVISESMPKENILDALNDAKNAIAKAQGAG